MTKIEIKSKSNTYIDRENQYGAHNYHPLPVVLTRGQGVHVWDVEGKPYLDFLSAYSALNQGHCHPRILQALTKQASALTLTSRAFYNDQLGAFEEYLCRLFGYDKALIMNTGVEAVETAMKLCRKWGYQVKGIPEGQAKLVFARNNFHGRTIAVISASNDEVATKHFGPFAPGIVQVPYNDVQALGEMLERDPHIAGFIVEPIQGEAGVILPDEDYLREVRTLCSKHRVLYVADEIQTGMGRTGSLLASYEVGQADPAQPDVVILGKALSGGVLPVSAVLAKDEVMLCIGPGEHGSTFGGNPLACAVATEAVQVILDEDLPQNARLMGQRLRAGLQQLATLHPEILQVRGKGLLCAIEIRQEQEAQDVAWDLCLRFMENGLLAKPTHGNIIRLAPPLIIDAEQIDSGLEKMEQAFRSLKP